VWSSHFAKDRFSLEDKKICILASWGNFLQKKFPQEERRVILVSYGLPLYKYVSLISRKIKFTLNQLKGSCATRIERQSQRQQWQDVSST